MSGALSDARTDLSFTTVAIPRQHNHHGTHVHILLSQIRDSPNLEGQVPVFISPRTRVRLYPQALHLSPRTRVRLYPQALHICPRYIALARTAQKTFLPLLCSLVAGVTCSLSSSLATAVVPRGADKFFTFPVCNTTKKIFLRLVKKGRTTKSYVH
jgi:hypothetical protein